MNKSEAIDAQINRISILTKRMERVTSFVKDKNDSAKSIQAAFLIVQIVLQLANCKSQIMIISSQPMPKDFTKGGILSGAISEQSGEFIIPKRNSS